MPNVEQVKKAGLGLTITLAVLAALMFLVAVVAFWFNSNIFNQAKFTQITTNALREESSRNAVATELSDRLFANRPLLARIAEEPTVNIISGALNSSLADKVFNKAVSALQGIATSSNPQDITLDLTGFKQVASRITAVFDLPQGESAVQAQDVPDSITLVDASKVPNIYAIGVVLLWAGPLALIVALIAFAFIVQRHRHEWRSVAIALAIQAAALTAVWVFALLVTQLLKPTLLANVQSSNMQTVVGNIYGAFANSFNQRVIWMFWIALALAVVALAIWFAKPVNKIVRKQIAKSAGS